MDLATISVGDYKNVDVTRRPDRPVCPASVHNGCSHAGEGRESAAKPLGYPHSPIQHVSQWRVDG